MNTSGLILKTTTNEPNKLVLPNEGKLIVQSNNLHIPTDAEMRKMLKKMGR